MKVFLLQASINTLWALNACAQHSHSWQGDSLPRAYFLTHFQPFSSIFGIFDLCVYILFFANSPSHRHITADITANDSFHFHEACLSNYSFSIFVRGICRLQQALVLLPSFSLSFPFALAQFRVSVIKNGFFFILSSLFSSSFVCGCIRSSRRSQAKTNKL